MNTRQDLRLVAFALLVILLLACDVAGLLGSAPSANPGVGGAVPTSVAAGQPSQVPDYLKCDPAKLAFPLLPDAKNCQHVDIITNFQTNLSPKDAIVYYNELLAKEDWKRKDDGALPGIGSWIKGTKQINILATVDKGTTSVQVQELGAAASAPTNVARGVTPTPTNVVRGITPAPTSVVRGITPLPTSRIRIPPEQMTAVPESAELVGDDTWTGMGTKGQILNFCVYRNNIYRIHYVTPMTCRDKQTRQTYSVSYNISPSDLPPFLIYPSGRFNVNGEYTIPEGVYKGVTIGILGYLRGSQGRLWVAAFSDNEVARCDNGGGPFTEFDPVAHDINVRRINTACSP